MKLPRRVLALLAALVLLAAAGVLLLVFLPRGDGFPDLDATMKSIDADIAQGYLDRARESLAARFGTGAPAVPRAVGRPAADALRPLPSREEDCLRVLKRVFQVCRASGDYGLLDDVAGRALAAHGRSARLRTVAAYAALRTGRLSEAERAAGRRLPRTEQGDMLAGEAVLRRGGQWAGSDSLTRELMALESRREPSAYASAALRTGEKRLSLDAALLAMEAGSAADARDLVLADLTGAVFDEPAAYILYDAGDCAGAVERLKRLNAARPYRPEIVLLMADAYAGAGNAAAAGKWLLKALPLAPETTWTAYVDLAFFAMQKGDLRAAEKHLAHGQAFFPGNRAIRMAQARLALRRADPAAARSLLTALTAEDPADSEAALLLLSLQEPGLSPQEYRARLWQLFGRVPEDPRVFATLCNALLAAHDWDGAGIALKQHQAARGGQDGELAVVSGLVARMQGRDAEAIAAFRAAADMAKDGVARYDLALVLMAQGNAREARDQLAKAMEEYRRNGAMAEQGKILSRMETLRAQALMLDGDDQAARMALGRALRLDGHNLRAGLLVRKLDAKGQ